MNDNIDMRHCINCGAPVNVDICPYCNQKSYYDTSNSYDDAPFIPCKPAHIDLFLVVFPLIFAVSFGGVGGVLPIVLYNSPGANMKEAPAWVYVELAIFALIGLGALIIALIPIVRSILIKRHGIDITGTVIGIEKSNTRYNGYPGKVLIIRIDTDEGPKKIKYDLGSPRCNYELQNIVSLRMYKNSFKIM